MVGSLASNIEAYVSGMLRPYGWRGAVAGGPGKAVIDSDCLALIRIWRPIPSLWFSACSHDVGVGGLE